MDLSFITGTPVCPRRLRTFSISDLFNDFIILFLFFSIQQGLNRKLVLTT